MEHECSNQQKMLCCASWDCKLFQVPLRDQMGEKKECYLAIFVETYYPSAGHTSEGIVVEAAWLQYQGDFGVQKGAHGLCLDACGAEDDVNVI